MNRGGRDKTDGRRGKTRASWERGDRSSMDEYIAFCGGLPQENVERGRYTVKVVAESCQQHQPQAGEVSVTKRERKGTEYVREGNQERCPDQRPRRVAVFEEKYNKPQGTVSGGANLVGGRPSKS